MDCSRVWRGAGETGKLGAHATNYEYQKNAQDEWHRKMPAGWEWEISFPRIASKDNGAQEKSGGKSGHLHVII